MRIARSKCLPMPWTRAGVRLIPEGHSANRSLSAIEPVSATAKRKLENGEQRPAPETYPARAEIPKITGQRLGSASVTRGNVADSHTPGNNTPETGLPGWANRIRTKGCTLYASYASLLADEKRERNCVTLDAVSSRPEIQCRGKAPVVIPTRFQRTCERISRRRTDWTSAA